jgi:hypothetical protein
MSTVDERVVERTGGHYEVQKVEFGRVYRWCPKRVVVECECGERVTLTGSVTVCAGAGRIMQLSSRTRKRWWATNNSWGTKSSTPGATLETVKMAEYLVEGAFFSRK